MFCINCGKEIKDSDKFCQFCGYTMNQNAPQNIPNMAQNNMMQNNMTQNNVNQNIMQNNNQNIPSKEEEQGITLCWIAFAIAFGSFGLYGLLNRIAKLNINVGFIINVIGYVMGLIMVIMAKSKCPSSKKINTFMIVYIVVGVLIIVGFILLLSALKSCIESCDGIA